MTGRTLQGAHTEVWLKLGAGGWWERRGSLWSLALRPTPSADTRHLISPAKKERGRGCGEVSEE